MWAAEVITSKNILLCDNDHFEGAEVIDKGSKITITKGREQKYAMWSHFGIFDLHERHIDESTIKIISNN
jgi:hypothetical protein